MENSFAKHRAYRWLATTLDHVHFYGAYVGNYPELDTRRIERLCHLLNGL
jgi:hypothetical protein